MLMFTAWMGIFTVRAEAALPTYGKIDESNAKQYLDQMLKGIPVLWLGLSGVEDLDAEAAQYSAHVHDAASQFPHLRFVWYDAGNWEERAGDGMGCKQYPCVSLVPGHMMNEPGKPPKVMVFTEPLELASGGIPTFVKNVLAGKIPPSVVNPSEARKDVEM